MAWRHHATSHYLKQAGGYNRLQWWCYMFLNLKTQHLLLHARYTRIVVFWHISNIPKGFRRVKSAMIPSCFVKQQYLWNIALWPEVGCHNIWADTRCSGCSPPGGNYCGRGLLDPKEHISMKFYLKFRTLINAFENVLCKMAAILFRFVKRTNGQIDCSRH